VPMVLWVPVVHRVTMGTQTPRVPWAPGQCGYHGHSWILIAGTLGTRIMCTNGTMDTHRHAI